MKHTPLKRVAFLAKKHPPYKKTERAPKVTWLAKKPLKKRKPRYIRIDPLDALFSEYVRRRAVQRVGGCERCLTPHRWQDLECSHFFGRADQSTRADSTNCHGLCCGCHRYLDAHPHEHDRWFKEKVGEQEFDMLEGRNRIFGKPDKKLLTLYYKQKIKEMTDNV